MLSKLIATILAPALLLVFIMIFLMDDFRATFNQVTPSFVLTYLVLVLCYICYALPFTIVIDAFVARLEKVPARWKPLVQMILFICTSLMMAVYLMFLAFSDQRALAGSLLLLFAVGACSFSVVEFAVRKWFIHRLLKKWSK